MEFKHELFWQQKNFTAKVPIRYGDEEIPVIYHGNTYIWIYVLFRKSE